MKRELTLSLHSLRVSTCIDNYRINIVTISSIKAMKRVIFSDGSSYLVKGIEPLGKASIIVTLNVAWDEVRVLDRKSVIIENI